MNDRLRTIDVPEGRSGSWAVEKFTVSTEDAKFDEMRSRCQAMQGRPYRPVPAGTYTKLTRGGQIVMSDTPSELRDLREPVQRATEGHILINGVGLGVVLQAILENPKVEHLTAIEISKDVIALVIPHWHSRYGDRLTVIQADAFAYRPLRGQTYQVVWHDVWDAICTDNLAAMRRLHTKYAKRCEWQGSWCKAQCMQARRSGW